MTSPRLDLVGQRFGRLQALCFVEMSEHGKSMWRCLCICGNETTVIGSKLATGYTRSCGCLRADTMSETMTTHGHRAVPEYDSWSHMIQRCTNSNNKDFDCYGGRGIQVCQQWLESFAAFYLDMGQRPSAGHSLDRYPNNDGNYEPTNCRWATRQQQAQNRRRRTRKGPQPNGI